MQQTKHFVVLDLFCPFNPLKTLKSNLKKRHLEKLPFYTCVIYMKIIWRMFPEILRQWIESFVILGRFSPFYSTNNPENNYFEKMKKYLQISSCYTSIQKSWSYDPMLHCSWNTAHDDCNFYFSLWATFRSVTPLTTQKMKSLKNEKSTWRNYQFTHVYQKFWSHDEWFLRYGAWRTERQTERRTEKVTYKDGCSTWKIQATVWKCPFQFFQNFGHITC